MEKFHARFYGTNVYINGKYRYSNNEILTAYLNLDAKELTDWLFALRDYVKYIRLRPDMSIVEIHTDYNRNVYEAQAIFDELDAIWTTLPPYDRLLDIRMQYGSALLRCLDRHDIYFHSRVEEANAMELYGYSDDEDEEPLDDQRYLNRKKKYIPEPMEWYWKENGDGEETTERLADIQDVNDDIEQTFRWYIHFLEDVLRVKICYAKLLDEYLHIKHGYLNDTELAKQFAAYFHTESQAAVDYRRLRSPVPLMSGHEVFTPEGGTPILCASFEFDRLGAFLYEDFFRGIAGHYIPKRCFNCGKWFLLPSGVYTDYCDHPLVDDATKTCRMVSARKKYDTKCKNDPVWTVYNRAYKTRYARIRAKKMTKAEFEVWARYAIKLRDKAERREITFEEYEREIRK